MEEQCFCKIKAWHLLKFWMASQHLDMGKAVLAKRYWQQDLLENGKAKIPAPGEQNKNYHLWKGQAEDTQNKNWQI